MKHKTVSHAVTPLPPKEERPKSGHAVTARIVRGQNGRPERLWFWMAWGPDYQQASGLTDSLAEATEMAELWELAYTNPESDLIATATLVDPPLRDGIDRSRDYEAAQ